MGQVNLDQHILQDIAMEKDAITRCLPSTNQRNIFVAIYFGRKYSSKSKRNCIFYSIPLVTQWIEVISEAEYLNQWDLSFIDKRITQALGVFHLTYLMLNKLVQTTAS